MTLMNSVQSTNRATIEQPDMEPAPAPGSMLLLTRLSRVVYRRASEAVLGMTLKEYMALTNLRDSKSMTQQALADALHLDPNNCVLLLNVLETGKLAERRRDATDRRRHIVELTPAGRRALERADRALESVEEEVLGALSHPERETLHRLLLRAVESDARKAARDQERRLSAPVTSS
jgi:DNA-binding MarR family transcriptional regulator